MINIMDYGYDSNIYGGTEETAARITAVHKERYEIICAAGKTFARLKSGVYFGEGDESFPTTGDFTEIVYNKSGDSLIVKTFPRRTLFSRTDPSTAHQTEQAVAANFDYVFVMQSMNQNFNAKRLERYVTLAWQSGASPVVLLTKSDLTDNADKYITEAEEAAPGVPVYAVSAKTMRGIENVSPYMKQGKTSVFLGSSGVGKSSLVNALAGEEIMNVSGIREDDARGRHTTTHRQLIRLSGGGMIIDTPGMRELGMWDVSSGLGEAFNDVESYFERCRFSDCRHENEPGCAVRAAIESGELSAERLESYNKLKKEARYSDDKIGYLRERQQLHKNISKMNRHNRKR